MKQWRGAVFGLLPLWPGLPTRVPSLALWPGPLTGSIGRGPTGNQAPKGVCGVLSRDRTTTWDHYTVNSGGRVAAKIKPK